MTNPVPALLFLALFGLTTAEMYTVAEGGNVTAQCRFHAGGVRKLFCKNFCKKKEDILAETSGDRAQKGRYSIVYSRPSNGRVMHVSIAHVTAADSGEYQCVLDRTVSKAHRLISLNVTAPSPLVQDLPTEQNLYYLLLLLIPAVLTIVFVICKTKKMNDDCGNAQNTKTIQENIYAPSLERSDSAYQSLSPATRDHNQIYSSLTKHQRHAPNYCNC